MKKIEYWINDVYYDDVEKNVTIFQKMFERKIDIPCFCYHENLSIAGNCRMCLVEVNTSVKLVASCAMPLVDGMKISTKSIRVKKARESVLEFLLINHPLDCPVCDQGGECDLQDIDKAFGSDKSRYYEFMKRAVFNKNVGVFINMTMTRCIHRTRCVRFFNEISGTNNLGMLNRGGSSEISTFVFSYLNDELSCNVVDLCPVGALTSQPYASTARPWELNYIESIDVMDSICSNVRIDFLNNKIRRVLPIHNRFLNEDWITNRARFFFESLDVQRLTNPMFKNKDNNFIIIGWLKVFSLFFFYLEKYKYFNILPFIGYFSDVYGVVSIKEFFNSIGTEIYFSDFLDLNVDFRDDFLFNNFLFNIENNLFFVFFCFNSRLESPIVNARLRKFYLLNDKIRFFGFGLNSSYLNLPIKLYSNFFFDLINVVKMKLNFNFDLLFNNYNYSIYNFFYKKSKIFFFFGISFFYNTNLFIFFKNWINLNFFSLYTVIFPFSGYLNFFEFGSSYKNFFLKKESNFFFFDNVDNEYFLNVLFLNSINNFIIYNGNFFDFNAKLSNLIIPIFSFFEYDSFFFNFEGKLKKNFKVINNNCKLITSNDFFKFLMIIKNSILFNNFSYLKNFYKIIRFFDFFLIDFSLVNNKLFFIDSINEKYLLNYNICNNFLLSTYVVNYYKMDVYSKNSKTLHLASFEYLIKLNIFF